VVSFSIYMRAALLSGPGRLEIVERPAAALPVDFAPVVKSRI
jgi:hypothetical protein